MTPAPEANLGLRARPAPKAPPDRWALWGLKVSRGLRVNGDPKVSAVLRASKDLGANAVLRVSAALKVNPAPPEPATA